MFIFDEEGYSKLLIKTGLTPNQFFFAYMLHISREDLILNYINSIEKFEDIDIQVLVDKEYIVDTNDSFKIEGEKIKEAYISRYLCTQKFLNFIKDEEDLFDELLEAYPNFIIIQDKKLPAKSIVITKDIIRTYLKNIKNNNKLLTGLEKFIYSKGWEALRELKEDKPFENKYDL